MKTKTKLLAMIVLLSFLAALTVSAQNGTVPSSPKEAAANVICGITDTIRYIVGALAVLYMIMQGSKLLGSGDNPALRSATINRMVWVGIGLLVVIFAGMLVEWVITLSGYSFKLPACMTDLT